MRLKCKAHDKRVHVLGIDGVAKAFHQTRSHVPCDSKKFTIGDRVLTKDEVIDDSARTLLTKIFTGYESL